ncbi:heme oxygenase-like protein [Fragilariopsis cylindrus CCMP1102]|uniref:Heme oxygenase-like protein n=1 Tax=Fragilariopsis cylindrus CCMP1102 TaxID=635003 RepID=A0A1E7FIA8_9STRA|nr:heme oxygenase-like protein [Fragilariopsis cylindrus CCMP1102]|eukprot:OEU17910.1 heme oxygenase-like protein [Fragilariopsis cylindrus CCMP1102]
MTTTKPITITCQSLWDKAYPIVIKETEKHPFLVSMVDGTLEENNFRYYVQQDVLYLNDFSYCLRQLALKKAPTTNDKNLLIDLADGAEKDEIALHNAYLKGWNTNEESSSSKQQQHEQMPNTLLYTSYMRRIIDGSETTYGEGLAVLLPCFWVYMHVGKCMLKLRNELDTNNTTTDSQNKESRNRLRPKHYNDWIDMYAGDEFEHEVNNYIQLVNNELQLNDKKVNEELKQIEYHFIMSCKLEHMFWDQAITMMEWPTI